MNVRYQRGLSVFASLSAAVFLCSTDVARAADVAWINSAGGDWNVGTNWSTGSVPTASDQAVFDALAGPYAVTVTGARSIAAIQINSSNLTLQLLGSNAFGSATLTVAGGFTNNAIIELVSSGSTWSETLTVSSGSLTNGPGGGIRISPGSGGGRTIAAQIENLGTINVNHNCTIALAAADHANSGTINVAGGNLTVTQSGTSPSFTNAAAIAIASGRMLTVSGGVFNHNAGSLGGTGATLALSSSATLNLGTDLNMGVATLALTNSTVAGSGTVINQGTLAMNASAVNAGLSNQAGALVRVNGACSFGSSFSNASGAVLEIQGANLVGSAALTCANGFTNDGLIELLSTGSTWSETLTVNSGSLTNTAAAEIRITAGTGGGRTLAAQLNNLGTINIDQSCSISAPAADHTNASTINIINGTLTISQSGTTPSFTNTGAIAIGPGRSLAVGGGTFNQNAGSIGGPGSTITLTSAILNLGTNFANGPQTLAPTNSTINGPGAIANDGTLIVNASVINAGLTNQTGGLVRVHGSSSFGGAFSNEPGAELEIEGQNLVGSAVLTCAGGFTNDGLVELVSTGSSWSETLIVTNGSLINSPGGEIRVTPGTGGGRSVNAQLDNRGVININHACGGNRAASTHLNSGTINVIGGDFTVTQSGTTPSFTNTGTIAVSPARTLAVTGGTFNQNAGSLGGTGSTVALNNTTVNFGTDFTNGPTTLATTNAIVNGPGVITNQGTFAPNASTINAAFDNQFGALLRCSGSTTFGGTLNNRLGAEIELLGHNAVGSSTATILNGFANEGLIELVSTGSTWSETLIAGGAGLNNAVTGEIRVTAGTGGSRTIQGVLVNAGVINVDAGRLLTVTGSLTQQDSGELNFFVAGLPTAQFSRVAVSGAASIGGTLGVTLINSFIPSLGDLFQIMTFGSLLDEIGCFDVAGLFFGTGLRYNLIRNPNNLTLEVVNTPVQEGDLRCDCIVDLVDLSILLSNFGSGNASQSDGDLNGDSLVDISDLAILLSLFGSMCPDL